MLFVTISDEKCTPFVNFVTTSDTKDI